MTATVTEAIPRSADVGVVYPGPSPRKRSTSRPEKTGTTDRILPGTRAVLVAFAVFTLLAAIELVVLPASTDKYFAWTIADESAAAFLGAGYAAGFLLSVLALRQDRWSQIRVAMLTVTSFTAVTLIATLLHVHKFHLITGDPIARLAAWVWLAVYVVIPFACLIVVNRQERSWTRPRAVRRPMPRWLAAVLAVQGITLVATGAALFAGGAARHHTVMEWTTFWPLPLAPLAAQTIGAWLVAFGIGAALGIRERDLSRLLLPAVAYTTFGALQLIVVIRYQNEVNTTDPWLWAYVALLASIVATGGCGWRASLARSSSEAEVPAGNASRGGR
jgi:hypothetical protein